MLSQNQTTLMGLSAPLITILDTSFTTGGGGIAALRVLRDGEKGPRRYAIDKAVASNKVLAAALIQSRIVGPFTGYTGRTVFTLENGQRWAQSQFDSAYFPKIDSPPVIIVKAGFGYRMYIAGGGAIRVSKVR